MIYFFTPIENHASHDLSTMTAEKDEDGDLEISFRFKEPGIYLCTSRQGDTHSLSNPKPLKLEKTKREKNRLGVSLIVKI